MEIWARLFTDRSDLVIPRDADDLPRRRVIPAHIETLSDRAGRPVLARERFVDDGDMALIRNLIARYCPTGQDWHADRREVVLANADGVDRGLLLVRRVKALYPYAAHVDVRRQRQACR